MQNMKLLLATLLITVGLVFGVGWALSKMFASNPNPAQEGVVVDQAMLTEGAEHVRGATESARFTIVEFSDLECPACAAAEPALAELVQKYPNDVRLVYRHFPLTQHRSAMLASQFAEAAAEQGKFWELHDLMFVRQYEWTRNTPDQNREVFTQMAQEVGINTDQLLARLDAPETQQDIQEDMQLFTQLNLSFTPSLFLNGEMLDIEEIQTRIEGELQQQ